MIDGVLVLVCGEGAETGQGLGSVSPGQGRQAGGLEQAKLE
jgi:hypothetical protein